MNKGETVKVVKVDGGAPDGLVGKTGEVLRTSEDGVLVRFKKEDLPPDAGWFCDWDFEPDDVEPA